MASLPDPELPDTGEYVAFEELVARFFEDEPRTAVHVEFGALSHRGLIRDDNEDHYLVVRRRRAGFVGHVERPGRARAVGMQRPPGLQPLP